jgi:hypothetical protein
MSRKMKSTNNISLQSVFKIKFGAKQIFIIYFGMRLPDRSYYLLKLIRIINLVELAIVKFTFKWGGK